MSADVGEGGGGGGGGGGGARPLHRGAYFVLGRWLNMHEPSLDGPLRRGVGRAEVIFSGFAPLWERSCEESEESLCVFYFSL